MLARASASSCIEVVLTIILIVFDSSGDLPGATVPVVAARIKAMCERWNCKPRGLADDACWAKTGSGLSHSIGDEFCDCGVYLRPARKGSRISGWETMRRLMADAGRPDVPGLYVSQRCEQWWETVPTLPRDPRHQEDVLTSANDHCADACRYAVTGMVFGQASRAW